MDEVPPESRASLAPLLILVKRSRSRTMSHKAAGTLLSRQCHFLKLLASVNLQDNIALLVFYILALNAIMACYVATLASGHTIQCESIQVSTVSKYISAAKSLSISLQAMNPLINIYGENYQLIVDIINETERWESMYNRQEPLTKDTVHFLLKKYAALNLPDGKYAIMTSWFIITLQAGFRRIKWSQDATKLAATKSFQCNIDGSSSAFIQSDFQFCGLNDRRLVHSPSLHIDDIATVGITWRFQKNLDNGQTIPFAKEILCPNLCCVSTALRI